VPIDHGMSLKLPFFPGILPISWLRHTTAAGNNLRENLTEKV